MVLVLNALSFMGGYGPPRPYHSIPQSHIETRTIVTITSTELPDTPVLGGLGGLQAIWELWGSRVQPGPAREASELISPELLKRCAWADGMCFSHSLSLSLYIYIQIC